MARSLAGVANRCAVCLRKDDRVDGITYFQGGRPYRGSEIGASWHVVVRRVSIESDNLLPILVANAKSQEASARSEPDRATELRSGGDNGKYALKGANGLKPDDSTSSGMATL